MRLLAKLGLLAGLMLASATAGGAQPPRGTCAAVCIDIFGGTLPIPAGYRLQTEFGDVLRFVRVDPDPRKGQGTIQVGKTEALPSRAEREKSAKGVGAAFTSELRGSLRVDVTTTTTQPLLADTPVRYVSASSTTIATTYVLRTAMPICGSA
jgi:hypothetical protein